MKLREKLILRLLDVAGWPRLPYRLRESAAIVAAFLILRDERRRAPGRDGDLRLDEGDARRATRDMFHRDGDVASMQALTKYANGYRVAFSGTLRLRPPREIT